MGVESIDSFDAKSYERRIEILGIRFDANRRTAGIRSKIDRFESRDPLKLARYPDAMIRLLTRSHATDRVFPCRPAFCVGADVIGVAFKLLKMFIAT